jgi:hypothetical protein
MRAGRFCTMWKYRNNQLKDPRLKPQAWGTRKFKSCATRHHGMGHARDRYFTAHNNKRERNNSLQDPRLKSQALATRHNPSSPKKSFCYKRKEQKRKSRSLKYNSIQFDPAVRIEPLILLLDLVHLPRKHEEVGHLLRAREFSINFTNFLMYKKCRNEKAHSRKENEC